MVLVFSGAAADIAVQSFMHEGMGWASRVGFATGAFVFTCGGLFVLLVRYRVNLAGVERRFPWSRRFVPWSAVREVWVYPNYFGSFNMLLVVRGESNLYVPVSMVGNRAALGKAILEAATTANPSCKRRGSEPSAYGPPPYGVFSQPDSESIAPFKTRNAPGEWPGKA